MISEEVIAEINRHLGKRVRRRRHLLGTTQAQLAEKCGVQFQQVQKYENAENAISAARLWMLSNALGVPVGYFYEGLENPETDETEFDKLARNQEIPQLVNEYLKLSPTQRDAIRRVMRTLRPEKERAAS